MQIVKKWNSKTREYDDVLIPDDWRVSVYEYDMKTMINCPNCGKLIPYGESYTSRLYHDRVGFGYGVCADCYFDNEIVDEGLA